MISQVAHATDERHFDAEFVNFRLEEAGRALLCLPGGRMSAHLPSAMPDVVRNTAEAYNWNETPIKPAIPDAATITRMDEALAWIVLIPLDPAMRNTVGPWSTHGGAMMRRIVGARTLVSPVTDRHLFSWRRLGSVLKANHESVRQWHGKGIDIIVEALNRQRRIWP